MKDLRDNIKSVLARVTRENAPMVFEAIQTENGYKNIEDRVIHLMIDENMTASATIPHIENTL